MRVENCAICGHSSVEGSNARFTNEFNDRIAHLEQENAVLKRQKAYWARGLGKADEQLAEAREVVVSGICLLVARHGTGVLWINRKGESRRCRARCWCGWNREFAWANHGERAFEYATAAANEHIKELATELAKRLAAKEGKHG